MRYSALFLASFLVPSLLPAQSLPRRVSDAQDGAVSFRYAARAGACGDGENYLEDGLGGRRVMSANGDSYSDSRSWRPRPCEPGPVRVVASVADGEIVRLRTYVGPPPRSARTERDLGVVSVREAVTFLEGLAARATGRVADEAFAGIVLADSTTPWPMLLRIARNDERPKRTRTQAAFWVSRGAAAALGLTDIEETDEDEVRAAAVFGLSRQPRETAVPELIEVARDGKYPAARVHAMFWLSQTLDSRAIAFFESILRD